MQVPEKLEVLDKQESVYQIRVGGVAAQIFGEEAEAVHRGVFFPALKQARLELPIGDDFLADFDEEEEHIACLLGGAFPGQSPLLENLELISHRSVLGCTCCLRLWCSVL